VWPFIDSVFNSVVIYTLNYAIKHCKPEFEGRRRDPGAVFLQVRLVFREGLLPVVGDLLHNPDCQHEEM